jgi:Icc-related predicted phosphoesterase
MRIAMISDMHSKLNFSVPEVDLLLIAGDICPAYHEVSFSVNIQKIWLNTDFRHWLDKQSFQECVCIFGNHDWIGEYAFEDIPILSDNFHILQDSHIELLGKKIYGTPWQLPFNNWAFNCAEPELSFKWQKIPEDTDILICHSPPWKIMDKVVHHNFTKHIGSKSLKKRIKEIKPELVVFGHNHGDNGIVEKDDITYVNCSLLDEKYKLVYEPIILEI